MNYLLTPISGNRKTGPIAVTTSSKATCPAACPFKKSGCYAKTGVINIHWMNVSQGTQGKPFPEFVKALAALPDGQLTRLNQAGDLPGSNNRINGDDLAAIVKAGKGKRFFSYTHKPVIGRNYVAKQNRKHIKEANDNGTVINLSGNDLAHADKLKALNIAPVVTVLPLGSPNVVFTPAGNKVVKCPAQTRDNVTCATCKLCAVGNRSVIVGFEAHGNAKRIVSERASQ